MVLSLIAGIVSTAVTAVAGALSAAGAALSVAGETLISTLGKVSNSVLTFLEQNLPKLLENLERVNDCADVCCEIGKKLGISDDEDPEELGNRILQAQENDVTPEQFEEYEDYVDAVKSFNLNEKLSGNFSPEEKRIMVVMYIIAGMEQNCGIKDSNIIIDLIDKNIDSDKIVRYAAAAEQNIVSLDKVNNYLEGNLIGKERADTEKLLNSIKNI
jgi:hypothetical protein